MSRRAVTLHVINTPRPIAINSDPGTKGIGNGKRINPERRNIKPIETKNIRTMPEYIGLIRIRHDQELSLIKI